MRSLDPCVCLGLVVWKPLVCSLVTEAGMKQGVYPTMEIPSSVCGYLSESVKCLIFSLGDEQGYEVSDLFDVPGVFIQVSSLISFSMHVLECEICDVL